MTKSPLIKSGVGGGGGEGRDGVIIPFRVTVCGLVPQQTVFESKMTTLRTILV